MKLIILKDNLKEGLSRIERAIGESNSLPILKHVLCDAKENTIRLSATNLELGVQTTVPAKVNESGSITIPFQTIHSIIQGSDAERITLQTEDGVLIVQTDNYHARIQGIQADEFPIIPKLEDENTSFATPGDIFSDAIAKVAFAAQISEIRPELGGVLIDFQTTMLKLVATDSFRLAERTILTKHLKTGAANSFKVIVPLKTIHEAQRIFSKEESLTFFIDKNQMLLRGTHTELVSRLLSGTYPDYEQIIPKENEANIIVDREKLMSAVRLVSTFSGRVNDIKVRMKKGSKALEVYSSNKELGENNYLIPAKTDQGEIDEISFNWRYLVDGIKALTSKEVALGLNGSGKPATLKTPDDATYLYLLMPIKES